METLVGRVRRIEDVTHDVRVVDLDWIEPETMPFLAGQFVSFSVPKAGLPRPLTRPYSIVSAPKRTTGIELLFNKVPDGPGSNFLFGLKVGDVAECRGPAGTFVLHDYPDRRLLLVAVDTGIAPLRSIILDRLPSPTAVTLLWELGQERDLYYQDELAARAAQHPEFSFTTILREPSRAWAGATGRVQEFVERHLGTVDDLAVYVCGGSSMIKDVVAMVRARGVCPIHREQYYRDAPAAAPER